MTAQMGVEQGTKQGNPESIPRSPDLYLSAGGQNQASARQLKMLKTSAAPELITDPKNIVQISI